MNSRRIEQSLSPSHRARRRSPDLRLPEPDNHHNGMFIENIVEKSLIQIQKKYWFYKQAMSKFLKCMV